MINFLKRIFNFFGESSENNAVYLTDETIGKDGILIIGKDRMRSILTIYSALDKEEVGYPAQLPLKIYFDNYVLDNLDKLNLSIVTSTFEYQDKEIFYPNFLPSTPQINTETLYDYGTSEFEGGYLGSFDDLNLRARKDITGNIYKDEICNTTYVNGGVKKGANSTAHTYMIVNYPEKPTPILHSKIHFTNINTGEDYSFDITNDSGDESTNIELPPIDDYYRVKCDQIEGYIVECQKYLFGICNDGYIQITYTKI